MKILRKFTDLATLRTFFPGAIKITWMVFYILMVHQECYWISEKNSCDHNGTPGCELSKMSKNQNLIFFKDLWSCCDRFSRLKTISLAKFHHRTTQKTLFNKKKFRGLGTNDCFLALKSENYQLLPRFPTRCHQQSETSLIVPDSLNGVVSA